METTSTADRDRKYAWDYFQLHSSQRIATFNFYITVATASAPTYVAAGSVSSGTGAITPALPGSLATNDILLLFLETANQAISISNQNGGTWTQVTNSPQGVGTAGGTSATRLTVFWSRYNGTQGAPTTTDSGLCRRINSAIVPVPHPTSRTRSPGRTSACSRNRLRNARSRIRKRSIGS